MSKKKIIIIILVSIVAGFLASKNVFFKKNSTKPKISSTSPEVASYWTCPMHPQIHSDHPGECPICHMKLVKVKAKVAEVSEVSRSQVQASSDQLALVGIQRQQVERMDLNVTIPVAGRLISSASVAFQVYESDLALVKPGLTFKGQSSIVTDEEVIGVITSVDSIIDPTSRTVRVIGRIEKGPKGLASEITFSGVISIPLKNRVSIPESSVLHTGKSDLVYVFTDGNNLSPREVKLGHKSEGFYEVISGLEPDEMISSGPNFLIDSEAKIRGTSEKSAGSGKASTPECPPGQHWDIPMSMCMPGKPK